MTLSELRSLLRLYVPHALTSVITDIQLNLILNEGVNDIASRTLCLPADTKFNAVADQQDYDLSSVVSRFLVIDKEGLFWTNGTRYKQLLPKTMKWLDEKVIYVIEDVADEDLAVLLDFYKVKEIKAGKRYDDRLIIVKK